MWLLLHQYDAGYLWNLLHWNNLCRCRCTRSRSYEVTISYTVSFRKHFDDLWQTHTCTCQRNTIEIDEREKKKPRRFLRWQIDLFQQRNSQGQNQFLRRFIMGNLVTFFIKKSLSTHRPIFNVIVRVLFCCFSSFQMSARPHFPTYNLLPTPMIFLQCQPQLPAGQSDKRKGCMNVHVRMHASQFPTL